MADYEPQGQPGGGAGGHEPAAYAAEPRQHLGNIPFRFFIELGVALVVMAAVAQIFLGVLFLDFRRQKTDPRTLPAAAEDRRGVTAVPELQFSPTADMALYRSQEGAKLVESAHFVDREKGIVAIPIDRAMDLIARRGIPAPKKSGVPTFAETQDITPGTSGARGSESPRSQQNRADDAQPRSGGGREQPKAPQSNAKGDKEKARTNEAKEERGKSRTNEAKEERGKSQSNEGKDERGKSQTNDDK